MGRLLQTTEQAPEAEVRYREALAIQKQLGADFPNVPAYRHELANSHQILGILFAATGRPKEAEEAMRDALNINKQLAADFPVVPNYRQTLAGSHTNLSVLLRTTGRVEAAESACREALTIQKQLAADFPSMQDYQNDVAGSSVNVAWLLRRRKEYRQAHELLEQALSHDQAALKANSDNPTYRRAFADHTALHAQTLVLLGDHSAAAQTAEQLGRLGFHPVNEAYIAACVLAGCAPLAQKDVQLPKPRRKQLAEEYGDRAMAALKQAVAAGYKNVAHMKKDPDLDPLRSREDFKKLLAELAKGEPPGKPQAESKPK